MLLGLIQISEANELDLEYPEFLFRLVQKNRRWREICFQDKMGKLLKNVIPEIVRIFKHF